MDRKGSIYKITNQITNKVYIGQTSRDIDIRFVEHINAKDDYPLHHDIKKYGWQNFKLELIETCELNELDAREKFWISNYKSNLIGYNVTSGGRGNFSCSYNPIKVIENDLIFKSKEDAARLISDCTSWSLRFVSDKIKDSIENKSDFLGYHFERIDFENRTLPSPDDELIDWIKTLNIRFVGKHIYSPQLDMDFSTIGEAAKYIYDNKLYTGNSKMPIQSLITSIGYNLKGKTSGVKTAIGLITFNVIPGQGTKNKGCSTPFTKEKVYCPQLQMTFDSSVEAAKYMTSNKLWTGIKNKTAKLRISDILNGVFSEYKGYSFEKV